jgi:hypothetical protein
MVGLGKTWRFTARNSLGVDIPASGVSVSARFVRFDTTGKQEFSADSAIYTNGSTIVNATYASGSDMDNATNKYLGGDFVVTVIAPSASNGRVDIYYERKVNALYPTNGNGRIVCSVDITTSGTFYKDFSI